MSLPIVVLGAGGHGKVIADMLLAGGERIEGFLDDGKPIGHEVLGIPVIGGADWLDAHPARVALGIGDNRARARLAERILATRSTLLTVVHPRAVVAASAKLEDGVVVMANASINPDAVIARGAIINTGAVVEHDCVIGAFAHVSPRAALAGGCRVGAFAHVGIGAAMLPGTSVGDDAVVGGGALVARDIPAASVASGVPARVTRTVETEG
jgi:sugar O-acyltransferase (sialic acid O-acetyltransferase NeuD family)